MPFNCVTGTGGEPNLSNVQALYPNNGSRWNDYIKTTGTEFYNSDDTVCDGTLVDTLDICIHGGEARQVVATNLASCDGLSIKDANDWFDWSCVKTANGILFFTKKLRPGKSLSDLITSTGFKTNQVNVSCGSSSFSTTQEKWWSNPVKILPDNSSTSNITIDSIDDDGIGPDEAFEEGDILFVENSRNTNGYNINMDKIAIVVSPSAVLTWEANGANNIYSENGEAQGLENNKSIIGAGSQKFLWLEGSFNGNANAAHGFYFWTVFHSQLRRVTVNTASGGFFCSQCRYFTSDDVSVLNTSGVGFYKLNSKYGRYNNLRISGGSNFGLYVWTESSGNVFEGLKVDNNANFGIYTRGSSNFNKFYNVISSANTRGMMIRGSSGTLIQNATLVNNTQTGITLHEGVSNNTLVNLVLAGNGSHGVFVTQSIGTGQTFLNVTSLNNASNGFELVGTNHTIVNSIAGNNGINGVNLNGSSGNQLYNLYSGHNSSYGFSLNSSNTNNFSGVLLAGSNGIRDCYEIGGITNPGLDNNCVSTHIASDFIYNNFIDLTNSFVGHITQDDVENTSDVLGSMLYGADKDFVNFEHLFRGWGLDGSYLSAATRGDCDSVSNSCRIWDWRLKSNDTVLLNLAPPVSNFACPAEVSGNKTMMDKHSTPNVFLQFAFEIYGDGFGDDDGLCESMEKCLYAPNIGAYQGEGPLQKCNFQDGIITGVEMFYFSNNGN